MQPLRNNICAITIAMTVGILCTACRSHFYEKAAPAMSMPLPIDLAKDDSKKIKEPIQFIVHAPEDMVGQNISFWDGTRLGFKNLYHYPLRTLIQDGFAHALHAEFVPHKSSEIKCFELRIDAKDSVLEVKGDEATYKLALQLTLYSTDGKLLKTFLLEKTETGSSGASPEKDVPPIVYSVIRGLATESIAIIIEQEFNKSNRGAQP